MKALEADKKIKVVSSDNFLNLQSAKNETALPLDAAENRTPTLPEDKRIYSSKVLIREEIYEIFMSLKRIKKIKSVSTLIDFALQEYIKNNKEDIKKTLYDSKNHEIL